MTIWEAIVEEQSQSPSVNIKGQFVDQDAGLLVGMVSLIDLFKFLVEYKNKAGNLDQLYEKNVRQFLGSRRKVNKGIVSTLNDNPQLFGLYNNGITIVASNYVKSDSDSTVEIRDPYVVNGCQTTRSIWQVLDGKLNSDGSARSDALNEWREGVERGGVIAKIVKSGEANILGSVDISKFHFVIPAKAGIQALLRADVVHIQGTLDSRLRGNDELGLAKSPYISNVNTA